MTEQIREEQAPLRGEGFSSPGIYIVDSYGRFKFLAEQERANAELLSLVAKVIRGAESMEQAGKELEACADAKKVGARLLEDMAAEAEDASEGDERRA